MKENVECVAAERRPGAQFNVCFCGSPLSGQWREKWSVEWSLHNSFYMYCFRSDSEFGGDTQALKRCSDGFSLKRTSGAGILSPPRRDLYPYLYLGFFYGNSRAGLREGKEEQH